MSQIGNVTYDFATGRPAGADVPPRIEFFMTATEDRAASLVEQKLMLKDVAMVRLRQPGSKDWVEQGAEEFVKQYEQYGIDGRCPPHWGPAYRQALERYKQGEDGPISGTDIRKAAIATPAQLANLRSMGVLSVEDVAQMNDETMRRVGMGSVALKERARAYLEAIRGAPQVQEVAQLRADNNAKDAAIADLQAQMLTLATQVAQLTGAKG